MFGFSQSALCVIGLLGTTFHSAIAWTPASTINTDRLAAIGLGKLAVYEATHGNGHCTLANAAIRREWYVKFYLRKLLRTSMPKLILDRTTLAPVERKAYSDAVLCLMAKPSKLSPDLVPGAKNRYDDFVAIHINNTLSIHATVCSQSELY